MSSNPTTAVPAFDFSSIRAREEELRRVDSELNVKKSEALKRAELLKQEAELLIQKQQQENKFNYQEFIQNSTYVPNYSRPLSARNPPNQIKFIDNNITHETEANNNNNNNDYNEQQEEEQTQQAPISSHSRVSRTPQSNKRPGSSRINAHIPSTIVNTRPATNILSNNQSNLTQNNEVVTNNEPVSNPAADDNEAAASSNLGAAATIRYQKARITALSEHIEKQNETVSTLEKDNIGMKNELNTLKQQLDKFRKQSQTVEQQANKEKTANDGFQKQIITLETQVSNLRKELVSLQKTNKELETESQKKELKLNTKIVEMDKLKNEKLKLNNNNVNSMETTRKENIKLTKENKKLLQQRTELLNAFKKQYKLIDILKKQKMHMEAARLLQFSEEEFAKSLEIGEI